MKTIQVLSDGRAGVVFATTKIPTKYYPYNAETDSHKLAETTSFYFSDSIDPTTVPTYHLEAIEVPEWMGSDEFCENSFRVLGMIASGVFDKYGENSRRIISLSDDEYKLFRALFAVKAFRSEFRKSLWNQFMSWMTGDSNYRSPWTVKQLEAGIKYI